MLFCPITDKKSHSLLLMYFTTAFTFLLILLEFHAMYFDHIQLLFPPRLVLLPYLCPLFFETHWVQSVLPICSCVCGYELECG